MEVGAIYLGLFAIQEPGRFHWAILVGTDENTALKVHAVRSPGMGDWELEVGYQTIRESRTACAYVKIGSLRDTGFKMQDFVEVLRGVPMGGYDSRTNEVFTCRIWVRWAVMEMNSLAIITCDDAGELEGEVFEFAMYQRAKREEEGDGPRIFAVTKSS